MTARLRTKLLKSRTGQAIEKAMHIKSWATICGWKPIVSLNPFRTAHNNAQEHGEGTLQQLDNRWQGRKKEKHDEGISKIQKDPFLY